MNKLKPPLLLVTQPSFSDNITNSSANIILQRENNLNEEYFDDKEYDNEDYTSEEDEEGNIFFVNLFQ